MSNITFVDRILIRLGMLPPPVAGNPARLEDLSIPRYPPVMEGLPVRSPADLLATQHELTRSVQQLIANRELLEAHYNPSMLRLAEFVQLLPASQSHHHRGAGGMLRHSLEVGFWALQQTEGKLIRGVITPQQRRLIEPRWRLAAFLAGICHDLGKVVTDLTVTDRAGAEKWRPYKYGIYQWAESNRLESYFLHWTEGRGKNHTNVSSTLIDAVISKESLDWIGDGSTDAVIWLTESLNNNPGSSNQIHNFVVKADQLSVERDLKSMGAAMAGYEIGVPIERYLTDIMRRLVQEGIWRINEPGARIWNLNGTTYLVWPMAGEEISRRTRDEDIPGLPKTPDGILDMMVEREIAFLREDGGGDSFFYIAPDIITEKIPAMRLKAIRLRDQALISSMPIPPVSGKIYLNKSDASPETNTSVAPLPDIAAAPAPVAMDDCSTPVERLGEPVNAVATSPERLSPFFDSSELNFAGSDTASSGNMHFADGESTNAIQSEHVTTHLEEEKSGTNTDTRLCFALSAGDVTSRHFELNSKQIELKPGPNGLPTIRDFDVLIYCTQLRQGDWQYDFENQNFDFQFSAQDFLKSCGRGAGGAQLQGLLQALERFGSSEILIKNSASTGEEPTEQRFKLISYATEHNSDNRISLTISGKLFFVTPSRMTRHIFAETMHPGYFKLKPMQRALYWLAIINCDSKNSFRTSIEKLHWLIGASSPLRNFRLAIQEATEHDLLDYEIATDEKVSTVSFKRIQQT